MEPMTGREDGASVGTRDLAGVTKMQVGGARGCPATTNLNVGLCRRFSPHTSTLRLTSELVREWSNW